MKKSLRCRTNTGNGSVQLLESDVLSVLSEALTAHVQAVLPDEAVSV